MRIMNANQLTEAFMSPHSPLPKASPNSPISTLGGFLGLENVRVYRLLFGCAIAAVVAVVILGGIKRIARVATVLVPFMVGVYSS